MLLNVWVAEWIKWNPFLTYVPLFLPTSLLPHFLISSTPNPPLISTFTSPLSPPHLSTFLPQYHHYPSPLVGTKVLVTTEGFMSEMRSWSAPALQMSRRPTTAVTDKLNYYSSGQTQRSLHIILLSRFWGEQHKTFQSQPTHPSTIQILSRGESTPHISALVQCTLKMALKHEGYITLLIIMWPPQPQIKLNLPYNLVCIGKILLPLLLTRFGLE